MKTKKILLLLFILISFGSFAQEKTITSTDDRNIDMFSLKANGINELKNFDWDNLKELFKNNEKDVEISLEFSVNLNSGFDSSDTRADKMSYKVVGKSSDVEKLLKLCKNAATNFIQLNNEESVDDKSK